MTREEELDLLKLYTVELQRINKPQGSKSPGTQFVKHCIKTTWGDWLRPIKYRNGESERKPVNDIYKETGWEWELLKPEENGYKIVNVKEETKVMKRNR